MILELVFIACLQVGGQGAITTKCTEHTIKLDPYRTSPMMCLMHAQQPMAAWRIKQKNYPRITRWSCRLVTKSENI